MARFLLEVQLPRLENKAPLSPFFLENVKQAKKMTQSTVTNTETDRRLERQTGQQSDQSPLGEWSKKKKNQGRKARGASPGFSFTQSRVL